MSLVSGLETRLRGWPDQAITIGLFAVAAVAVMVALFARPIVKPAVLAWMLAP